MTQGSKKRFPLLTAALWVGYGIFAAWRIGDYLARPAHYAAQSAPWYLPLLLWGLVAAALTAVFLAIGHFWKPRGTGALPGVILASVLILGLVFALIFLRKSDTVQIQITLPAGSAEAYVFSEEEISATGKKITISSGEGLGDTAVLLSPVSDPRNPPYAPAYLTPGMAISLDAIPGEWFKIGISAQNETDTDKVVSVVVKGAEVRIP